MPMFDIRDASPVVFNEFGGKYSFSYCFSIVLLLLLVFLFKFLYWISNAAEWIFSCFGWLPLTWTSASHLTLYDERNPFLGSLRIRLWWLTHTDYLPTATTGRLKLIHNTVIETLLYSPGHMSNSWWISTVEAIQNVGRTSHLFALDCHLCILSRYTWITLAILMQIDN